MSSCKKSTTCTNKKASQLWPNHGCHPSKSESRWMSWTRSCRSRLGKKRTAPSVLIGVADIPQAQKQEAVAIDLSKDGNILLYGSPGTGKTTFLQTAAMDLARKQSPENLTMYLLDFGTNGLAPLSQLHMWPIASCWIRRRKSRIHPNHQSRVGSP